ncbi:MAG: DUF86 domain-containing protein [Bryobacter sp.]|jgi:uncharacterized protein with HEPN domain|nr:DUF86 domain-containing protein [Bryobacter sp.]
MRRDDQRLLDVLESLDWISTQTSSLIESEFLKDEKLCYAIAQKLTVVGEAVARLTSELKERYPDIPWADVVGLRNILVHEYFGIYWPLVWQTVQDDVPGLRAQIAAVLASLPLKPGTE